MELLTSALHRLLTNKLKLTTEDELQKMVEFERDRAENYRGIMMNQKMPLRKKLEICKEYDIPLKATPLPHFVSVSTDLTKAEKIGLAVEFGFDLSDTAPGGSLVA